MLKKLSSKIPVQVLSELESVIREFDISNPFRLSHFLAQCAHESGNFKHIRENLNYSAEGLVKVFPKYFSKETALWYARKPEAIANVVYGGRMGNGDKNSGDGWKYRGRGFLQLTGKVNYQAFSNHIVDTNIMIDSDLVATKYPLTSAAWFFETKKLWKICDEGLHADVVKKVTYRVNGGYNGLADRLSKTEVLSNLIV
jgi:putative chitinase